MDDCPAPRYNSSVKVDEAKINQPLTQQQRDVLLHAATEAPFSGEYVHFDEQGTYLCAACGAKLFSSETKFDSGSGWPSFYDVIDRSAVVLNEDTSHGMQRVEVVCANCGCHLGHVFHDAPEQPTGMRFCVNSVALNFKVRKNEKGTA